MQLNLYILFVLIAPAISIAGFFVYRIQMGGSQRIFPIAKALCDVTATDDLDGGRGLSPLKCGYLAKFAHKSQMYTLIAPNSPAFLQSHIDQN